MIPLVAVVAYRPRAWPRDRRRRRVPVPLFLAWLLLLPFAVVLLPVFLVVCARAGVDPLRLLAALWQVLAGLRRTRVEIEQRDTSILIHIL